MRSPFKTPKGGPAMSTSAAPVQASDLGIAANRSEKSNAWSWEERLDIYSRRRDGEAWDTICPDYPHRSKHAMEQQYSIMKKNAASRTPVKPNDSRRRKASVDAVHASVNGTDGANDGSDDDSGSDRDDSDSADARSRGPASRPTRKVRRVHTDSDENTKSKKKPSALKPRLSKRLKQSAKDQIPDGSDRPDEPVSTRPKRSRAPPKNYSLLLPNSDDLNEESDVAVAPEGLKKSKIVILGTGPPKKQQNGVRDPEIKTVRSSASPDSVVEVRKSPASPVEYQKVVRKSTRGKKMADDHLTTTRMGSDALRKKMKTPKGRKPRMLAHLDPSDVDTPSVPATASAKKGQKRKRSEDRVDNIRPVGRVTTSPVPDAESEQPEKKKRRKQKVRHDLGFLPNGQPRMRRRRRTRHEMELDQQSPKTVTTRQRGKYQFPYLDGYIGPDPPDMATVIARQEEMERQNRAPNSSSDEDSESALESVGDDTSIDTPTKEPDPDPIDSHIKPPNACNTEPPVFTIPSAQAPPLTAAMPTEPNGIKASLRIPDIVFFPEDLVRGRENATQLRSAIEAEKGQLADEKQRVADLTRQLSDDREGFTVRLKVEKQEHERAMAALQASAEEEGRNTAAQWEEKWATHVRTADEMSKKATETNQTAMDQMSRMLADATTAAETMIKQLREKDEVIRQLQQTTPFVEKNHHHHHHHNNNNNNHHPAALTEQNPTTAVLPPPSPHHHPPPFPAPTPPTPRPSTIKPLISSLRDSHIRLAGHLRTTTAAHTEHEAAVRQLHADLEEGEIAMRRVRNVVKGLVAGAGKVGAELEKAAGESDGVKGRVMALMDRVE